VTEGSGIGTSENRGRHFTKGGKQRRGENQKKVFDIPSEEGAYVYVRKVPEAEKKPEGGTDGLPQGIRKLGGKGKSVLRWEKKAGSEERERLQGLGLFTPP